MPLKTVDIRASPQTLRDLLELVRDGDEVVLTAGETPLVRLVPIVWSTSLRQPGLHPGVFTVADDFDAPLPDETETGPA